MLGSDKGSLLRGERPGWWVLTPVWETRGRRLEAAASQTEEVCVGPSPLS